MIEDARSAASKAAEKEYLGRTGGGLWEREKPFSPPNTDTFAESIGLLHDFAVAATLLQPGPDDRIVDLGAGGGWCSDLLQRLNRRVVSVDISAAMLNIARGRPGRTPIAAVAGDVERLPFRNAVFDKAICLNALHHVPDMAAAVREIARVLSPNGVAVFSEPGAGHAAMPASVAAQRDFGVLEQEVLIEPFMDLCHAAGFARVRVVPMAYVIPLFELSRQDWRAWQRLERTRRPVRAFRRLKLALMEIIGMGKDTVLFEEAFSMRLVRLLQKPVAEHPFFLATKAGDAPAGVDRYGADLDVRGMPDRSAPGAAIPVNVGIHNTGTLPWRADAAVSGHVRLGVQLLDAAGKMVDLDFARFPLGRDVRVGESQALRLQFHAPTAAGQWILKFDLVAEGRTWFEQSGTRAPTYPLLVTSHVDSAK